MKNEIINFNNIQKTYKDNIVHKNINLKVYEYESLAIIGSNGAGKTQLMKIMVSLVKEDSGEVNFLYDLKNPLNNISMQFQDDKMNLSLKTKDLIKFTSKMHKDTVVLNETEHLINLLGVDVFLNKKINKLSGGQKQRLNLLLALMRNTKILVLDEFTNSLDISILKKIFDYISKIKKERKMTIIMITHQPEELRNLSERIVLMKNGIIENEFLTKDIDKKYKGNFSKFLMECID